MNTLANAAARSPFPRQRKNSLAAAVFPVGLDGFATTHGPEIKNLRHRTDSGTMDAPSGWFSFDGEQDLSAS